MSWHHMAKKSGFHHFSNIYLFIYLSLFLVFFPNVFHTYKERKEDEVEKVKHEENSQNYLFRHTYFFLKKKKEKTSTPTFRCMVYVWFTPS